MKTRYVLVTIVIVATLLLFMNTAFNRGINTLALPASPESEISYGFTYQGYMELDGTPADDMFDFSFEIFDAEMGGDSWGVNIINSVKVDQGNFSVVLEYDQEVFNGDERWLEIGVRKEEDEGDYFLLDGRQPLTPVPYALYGIRAGEVDWYDIDNRPAGLDDGDDNTTYSAGFGLELDGTTFNVMTDTLQMRVTGGCDYGSAIRGINPDGAVECESHDTLPGLSLNTIDPVFISYLFFHSMTTGADCLPITCYSDELNGLKVAHCTDISCTSAISQTLDTSVIGIGNSIAIGADGLPVISYMDESNGNLKVVHCNDVACITSSANAVGTAPSVGGYTDITIGVDGLPVISYWDYSNGDLKVAHCDDAACTSASSNTVDSSGDASRSSSITIGSDGLPVISYWDHSNDKLILAHCNDVACTTSSTNILDTLGNVSSTGSGTSITIGSDGLPVISYYDFANKDLKVAHCNDIACTSPDITAVDTTGAVGEGNSIAIGSDGLPVISYLEETAGSFPIEKAVKVAHCNNLACTSTSNVTALTTNNYIVSTAITIGVDGLPVVSFNFDVGFTELKAIHCSNVFCVPNWRR